jgi:hypothetical protein
MRSYDVAGGGRSLSGLHRLLISITCLLLFQGASAIDFHFSANSGGGTVGIVESYDVDDSIGIGSRASASFNGGVSIDEKNYLKGSGNANIYQAFYGSGGGADYTIYRALDALEASKIKGSGSSALTPTAGKVSSSISSRDCLETDAWIWGTQGGDEAGVESYAALADISASQAVATGGSVAASQKVEAQGDYAVAYGEGVDSEGSYVDIYAQVSDGTLDASQGVEAGNSAAGRQSAVVDGYFAYAYCTANNPDKNYYAYVDNYIVGNAYFEFLGEAEVDESEARAHQISYAEGDFIWPWAQSTGDLDERLWSGTKSFESWAWTNANDYDQDIVEL